MGQSIELTICRLQYWSCEAANLIRRRQSVGSVVRRVFPTKTGFDGIFQVRWEV